jgi:hypothetical protein
MSVGDVTPVQRGNKAAAAVLEFYAMDGANSDGDESGTIAGKKFGDYTAFAPANPPQSTVARTTNCASLNLNRWQPLMVMLLDGTTVVQKWAAPHMIFVSPFSSRNNFKFARRVPGPPLKGADTDAAYTQQLTNVLQIAGTLDDTMKTIAEFWADGPGTPNPPGHWHRIAVEAIENEGIMRNGAIKLLFLQSNAAHDGGLACWTVKRIWDSIRPITAIQCMFAGQTVNAWAGPYMGVQAIQGENWTPYQEPDVVTPPFAAYISGHSTFSAASAEVFRRWFGDDTFRAVPSWTRNAGESLFEPMIASGQPGFIAGVTDTPNSGPATVGYGPAADVTLSWNTWNDAVQEAGMSRIFGGIHIAQDNIDGQIVGRLVGEEVWRRANALFNGRTIRQKRPDMDPRANF